MKGTHLNTLKSKGRLPKSQTSRQNQNQLFFMEQMNFHKQKLYSLIVAVVAFISLILPWITISYGFGSGSVNGFRSWGILSLLGIAGIAVACFMGDKTKPFDDNSKKIAMASFGAVALGALVFFLRLNSYGVGFGGVSAGFGLWICLLAGLVGIAWVAGLIKLENKKPPSAP